MSPSAAELAAARPKCRAAVPTGTEFVACDKPLRYEEHGAGWWRCPDHGRQVSAPVLRKLQAELVA